MKLPFEIWLEILEYISPRDRIKLLHIDCIKPLYVQFVKTIIWPKIFKDLRLRVNGEVGFSNDDINLKFHKFIINSVTPVRPFDPLPHVIFEINTSDIYKATTVSLIVH